jgi:hypothetical protein
MGIGQALYPVLLRQVLERESTTFTGDGIRPVEIGSGTSFEPPPVINFLRADSVRMRENAIHPSA